MRLEAGLTEAQEVIVGNTVSFSFGMTAGLRYRVDYKNSLNDAKWTPLGAAQLATGAPIMVSDNISSAPRRFYRIVVVP